MRCFLIAVATVVVREISVARRGGRQTRPTQRRFSSTVTGTGRATRWQVWLREE